VKPTHTSAEATDMAAANKVSAASAAKTTTTAATVGSCPSSLSQGDRRDAN